MSLQTTDARLASWEDRTRWLIVVAAIAPFVGALLPIELSDAGVLVIDLASWTVFVVDLVVHVRLRPRYLRTGSGLFDLTIVLFTFPWYIFPAVGSTAFLAVFRMARLLRLLALGGARRRMRYLYDRLGGLGLGVSIAMVTAALIVLQWEPAESGFADFGDSLWWAIVTLTTVGYGDFTPVSHPGRIAGVLLMVFGLATLGTLSGVLASMFGGAADEGDTRAARLADVTQMADQMDRLEQQLAEISARLDTADPTDGV